MLVFRFCADVPERVADPAGSAEAEQEQSPAELDYSTEFMHCGYINFSSWHFAGLRVHEVSEEERMLHFLPDGLLVQAQAAPQADRWLGVMTDVEFIHRHLNLEASQSLRIFAISLREELWQRNDTSSKVVPLEALPGQSDFRFWKGWSFEKQELQRLKKDKRKHADAQRTPSFLPAAKRMKAHAAEASAALPNSAEEVAPAALAPATTGSAEEPPAPASDDADVNDLADEWWDALLVDMRADAAAEEAGHPYQPQVEDDGAESDGSHVEQLRVEGDVAEDGAGLAGLFSGSEEDEEELPTPELEHVMNDVWGDMLSHASAASASASSHAAPAATELAVAEPAAAASRAEADRAAPSGERGIPEEFVLPELGRLRHYADRGILSAVCQNKDHGDCRITRSLTSHPLQTDRATKRGGQGRPLGLMTLWLQQQHDFTTRDEHVNRFRPTLQERQEARAHFLSLPGGCDWSRAVERPQDDGEPEEPTRI